MKMIGKDDKTAELEVFFAAARDEGPEPSAALLARVLADAQAGQRVIVSAPARARRSWLRQLIAVLGGWPAVTGLAAAMGAGVIIGAMPPDALTIEAGQLLSGDAGGYAVDMAPDTMFAMAEGAF